MVILLRTMNSLKQLYTMTMASPSLSCSHSTYNFQQHDIGFIYLFFLCLHKDVHARYRTEAHQDVVGRFNER